MKFPNGSKCSGAKLNARFIPVVIALSAVTTIGTKADERNAPGKLHSDPVALPARVGGVLLGELLDNFEVLLVSLERLLQLSLRTQLN
jgi:hypothetical protein